MASEASDRRSRGAAAVFYPWGDILQRDGGASVRTGHLIDFLHQEGFDVTVVSPGTGADTLKDGVRYLTYSPPRSVALLQRLVTVIGRTGLAVVTLGASRDEDFMLWNHLIPRLDWRFRRFARSVVQRSDAVYLEYTFLARPVLGAAERAGATTVTTAHDVLASQIKRSRLLARLTQRQEVLALRRADLAVCVSAEDRDTFERLGVDAALIPHGIDTRHPPVRTQADARRRWTELTGVECPPGPICLFVGSAFSANFSAVDRLRELAGRARSSGDLQLQILVVGGCCEPSCDVNFTALGRVSNELLEACYQLADLVLVPLESGTGASVKTIEAMALGKLVIGTSVGMRGYPVTSGVNCVLSDDLDRYPALIVSTLQDATRRADIEREARRFGQRYDFRQVYRPYVDRLAR